LLAGTGLPLEVVVAEVDEHPTDAAGNAAAKLAAVAEKVAPGRSVVAADTVVRAGGRTLGTPRDAAEAVELLRVQSGRVVEVVTAVAVRHEAVERFGEGRSWVELRPLEPAEVEAYVASGAADGKAGGLEVQGGAAPFVSRWGGCWANILGLPLAVTLQLLGARLAGNPCLGTAPGGDRRLGGIACGLCPAPHDRHGPLSPAAPAASATTAP
jgi:septum formation protein